MSEITQETVGREEGFCSALFLSAQSLGFVPAFDAVELNWFNLFVHRLQTNS